MTTWSPDTCGCVIDNYDNEQATFSRRCPRHGTASPTDVMTENQYKNRTITPLVENGIQHQAFFDNAGKLIVVSSDPAAPGLIADGSVEVRSAMTDEAPQ